MNEMEQDGPRCLAAMICVVAGAIAWTTCTTGCREADVPSTQNVIIASSYAVELEACDDEKFTADEARACLRAVSARHGRKGIVTKDGGSDG